MSDDLADWPKQYYEGAGGRPFLFYVVYGAFGKMAPLSRSKYRSSGPTPGVALMRYGPNEHPDVVDDFRSGYLWDKFNAENPALAKHVLKAKECMVMKGELEDQPDLNYFRDTIGLLTFLLDNGGIVVYDPQMFRWWSPGEWRQGVFHPEEGDHRRHVVILTSDETDTGLPKPSTWFHTRGMRKFGRPDISVHHVQQRYHSAVIELLNRFIEFQALGGVIEEGKEIRMKSLPTGMVCHHAGDLDDPDFNNVHVEITLPASEG